MSFRTIAPTEAQPTPNPSCSGNWLRLEDGSVQPADEPTAAAADLLPVTPAPAPAPEPSPPEEP